MTDEELKDLVANLVVSSKETHLAMRETRLSLEELGRKVDKIDRWMEGEVERRRERTDRWWDELCYEEEYYSSEKFFRDTFGKKVKLGDVEFGGIKYGMMTYSDGRENRRGEKFNVGLVLIGEDTVVLIEAKERMDTDFVTAFAQERAGKFREFYREFRECKAYLGIAAYSFDDAVLEEAKKHGIGIVRKVGEGIEIEAENLKVY